MIKKSPTLYFLLFLCLSNCFGQKKGNIQEIKREYLVEKITEHLKEIPLIEGDSSQQVMTINNQGLYIYIKDSTLVNANMEISLYSESKDTVPSQLIGYLKGLIIEGKKEGSWTKEFKSKPQNKFVTVKEFNYFNGALDGKYQVFDTSGKILSPFLASHFDRDDKNSFYEMFKNGRGHYFDYYYDTGILKEKGFYLNGKKHSVWILCDREGMVINKKIYNNGVIVNE